MATVINRKFAVVTGGSSGIGFALARQCIANGFDVLICAETDGISEAAERLRQQEGAMVYPVKQDLSTLQGVKQLADEIKGTGRPVDALLLNAGVGQWGPFTETPLEKDLEMINLNCVHTVMLAKLIIPDMAQRRNGRVLVTGSVVSTAPAPLHAVYGATKAFVMSFAEGLREELKDKGVSVTTLQPGPTETNFFERADMTETKVGQEKKDDPMKVAKDGFDAMMAGRSSIVGGSIKSKVKGALNEVLPEPLKAKQMGKEARPVQPNQKPNKHRH